MKKKRRKFTDKFKDEAVKLVLDQGHRISEAARNLDIHVNLLGHWKREHEDGDQCGSATWNTVAMKTELNRLRKENKRFKMERILFLVQPWKITSTTRKREIDP